MIRWNIAIFYILILLAPTSAIAGNEKTFAICYKSTENGFGKLKLPDRIYDRLAGYQKIRIVTPERSDSVMKKHPRFASDFYEPDLMMEMAYTLGVRYLVWLKVEKAMVKQSAHTIIPYVFRSYHRKYILGVRIFVVDSYNKKTVFSDYFETSSRGPAVISYLDYDPNDPGLAQKYSLVREKYNKMEEEIADRIVRQIEKVAHRR